MGTDITRENSNGCGLPTLLFRWFFVLGQDFGNIGAGLRLVLLYACASLWASRIVAVWWIVIVKVEFDVGLTLY